MMKSDGRTCKEWYSFSTLSLLFIFWDNTLSFLTNNQSMGMGLDDDIVQSSPPLQRRVFSDTTPNNIRNRIRFFFFLRGRNRIRVHGHLLVLRLRWGPARDSPGRPRGGLVRAPSKTKKSTKPHAFFFSEKRRSTCLSSSQTIRTKEGATFHFTANNNIIKKRHRCFSSMISAF